ncbi:3-dehydroquinate synthase [Desulfotomaculum sp. 1211_IL3151]|uniref:3-dehydroquinate synthase n=1 Tax=Desulfotomaculum sp. 1211_IL3151 TaxID=3084055 RepID=UPI002FD892CB
MKLVTVNASKSYEIIIEQGILAKAGQETAKRISACTAAIVTDNIVDSLYSDVVCKSLQETGFSVCKFVFTHGEASKNLTVFGQILEFFAQKQLTKSDLVVALGGGVIGDIAGFAASVYLRGIRFMQIPTTYLAAIDSSVGGKTAIDLAAGKNLAGTFYQPSLVLCDPDSFATLPEKVFADGTAEAIKYGVLAAPKLFDKLAQGQAQLDLVNIIEQCVKIKRDLVMRDEFDNGDRQLLNFGHTIGHAIEHCSGYRITHGHAVAMGMVTISKAAWRLGLSAQDCSEPIKAALLANNLPFSSPFTAEQLALAALLDKKRRLDNITLVIPIKIGQCVLHKIPVSSLYYFINQGILEEA